MSERKPSEPQRITYSGDGITLVADGYGDPAATPILFLHGGGQTRYAWARSAKALAARGYYAVALDLRGHGESDWSPDGRYDGARFTADGAAVAATFTRLPIVVGASLGGMVAMMVEGHTRPGSFAAVVLVDVAHEMRNAGVARVIAFMESGADGFGSLEEASDAVASYLDNRKRPSSLEGLKKNLRLRDDGRWYWHWDPRMLDNTDVEEVRRDGRFVEAARNIRVPVLLVRGAQSDVVDETIARELLELIPHARYVDVAGAAHMVAGDENDAFTDAVVAFCDELTASKTLER